MEMDNNMVLNVLLQDLYILANVTFSHTLLFHLGCVCVCVCISPTAEYLALCANGPGTTSDGRGIHLSVCVNSKHVTMCVGYNPHVSKGIEMTFIQLIQCLEFWKCVSLSVCV